MLKIVMLLIGVFVLALASIAAFIVALPVLPFVIVGLILWKVIRARSSRRWTTSGAPGYLRSNPWLVHAVGHSSPLAPITLLTLAMIMVVQIEILGFYPQLELGLFVAMLVVVGLWWVQRQLFTRHTTGRARKGSVAAHDLYQLFEIERATGTEERRVLIARELNRLTREALRPDPTLPDSWPSIPELSSLRDQVRLLRSSARDTHASIEAEPIQLEQPSTLMLTSGIQVLEEYVNRLLRVRVLGQGDLEQMRILVRDQSRLRAMQDEFVGHLQEPASSPAVG